MMTLLALVGRHTLFAFQGLLAALRAVRQPVATARSLAEVFLGALPLASAAGVALGVVVWLHLNHVANEGIKSRIPEYLAQAVILEFAPLGAGLIVAGRSGASLGAELSSMKLTEQVDALEAMGLSPMRYLVGPRVLACMIALPLLTIFIALFALVSSYLAEMAGGTLISATYLYALERGLENARIVSSTLKTAAFGYLIGVAGCFWGLEAAPGSEGVGRAATYGVVGSTFLVLIANVFLVKLLQAF